MNELDLDHVYTQLCRSLSEQGEANTAQVLSRFALLAMLEINDVAKIEKLIARAAVSDAQVASVVVQDSLKPALSQ